MRASTGLGHPVMTQRVRMRTQDCLLFPSSYHSLKKMKKSKIIFPLENLVRLENPYMKPILENFNCKLVLQILEKEDVSSEQKSPQQYYFKKNGLQHGEKMFQEQDRRR